jgi:hypothetical protein
MLHATYTQGNWVDSRLLVVGSQIANWLSNFLLGHNLCFRCPNESCKPILDIYVSIVFQWYKKNLWTNGFWPLQFPFEDLEVHWNSNSQNKSSLGSVKIHSLTFFCTPGSTRCDSQASLLVHHLANPCLGHEPKARVATQNGSSFGSVKVHSLTLFCTFENMKCDSWLHLGSHFCKPLLWPWTQGYGCDRCKKKYYIGLIFWKHVKG